MRLLILSLLALGGAHGHTLAYRSNLLSYAPARGEFSVEHGRALGYVRYLDGSGAERLLPYYYPEPLYGVRRLSYGALDAGVNPLLRTTAGGTNIILKQESSSEQNALFRAWCEERYNALKIELDRLRSEGKTPSANMMAQFIPLEQIIKASAYDGSIVSGLSPEVQKARDEHLRIWNETRLRVLKAEEEQMRLAGTKLSGEYNPQEDLQLKQFDVNARIGIESQGKPIVSQQLQQQPVQDTPEVLRAREEHLKLFQQSSSKQQQELSSSSNQIQLKEYNSQSSQSPSGQLALQPIQDTPEVQRVREEHLKLFNQAQQQQQQQSSSQQGEGQFSIQSQQQPAIKYFQPQAPQDTPEVLRAREEHLKLLNEAKLKQYGAGYKEQQQQQQLSSSNEYQQKYETEAALKYSPQFNVDTRIDSGESKPIAGQLQPLQDTPEVLKAREEHLRLIEQAKLKAQSEGSYNENDDGSYKGEQQQGNLKLVPGIQQPNQQQQQANTLLYQGGQPNLKSSSYEKNYNYQEQQQWGVQETAEVLKAREEHFRLVNEAKVRIEDRIADDADRIKLLEREGEDANQLREYEMRREEEKQQELERLREEERQKEEKRLLEEERIALQLEEQRRLEMERAEEAERIKKEEIEQLKYKASEYLGQPELQQGQIFTKFIAQPQQLISPQYQQSLQQAQSQQQQQQLQQNGLFLRIQSNQPNLYAQLPAGSGAAAYIVGAGQQIAAGSGGQYYIPATQENPFLLRYTQDIRPLKQEYIKPIALTTAIVTPSDLFAQKLKSDGGYAITSGSSSSSLSSGSSAESSNFSELDKATRNHFRAHEIALEQLRLANQKKPWSPDCN